MKKWVKILMHAIFWFYVFAWHNIIGSLFTSEKSHGLSYYFDALSISHYILFPSVFYFNYFFILPRFYKKNKILKAWIGWVLLLLSFIALRYLIQEVLFFKWFGIKNYFEGTTIGYYIYDNIYYGGLLIIMSILFWILDDNIKSQKEKYLLLEEKKTAQLAFLKNQVNPHFIFNTLNNIYSLVSSKSDKALPSIEKLSHLMRYMYKDSDAEQVSLQREIEYINSFIELQTIRLSNKDSIHYSFEGNITQQTIAPLLLIPFIENMFKHGILNNPDKPLQIKINVQENKLTLSTSNCINNNSKDNSSGIGLNNVKRRLELLYPDQHILQLQQDENMYHCNLQINLSKQ
ncbi:sensor histidine kinase [Ferruginibacter sp.]|nr:histidine kinase [Ferruginibacter sp.]